MNDLAFCISQSGCGLLSFKFVDGTILTGTIKNSVGATILTFDQTITTFQVDEDDVYFITIAVNVDDVITYYNFSEFVFCKTIGCVKGLLKDIFCKEDACCENCDEKADSKKRYTLNKIMAAYMTFNSLIDTFKLQYSTSFCESIAVSSNIAEILEWHKILLKLTKSCGNCSGTIIPQSTPCKTC